MKKLGIVLACFTLSLTGCTQKTNTEKKQITTTIFPIYDITRQLLGEDNEHIEVDLLVDTAIDFHSYQPTADDMIAIVNSDLFIYVGGYSDTWVEEALDKNKESGESLSLVEVLGDRIKEEELKEGMEEHDHHHDEDCDHEHDEDCDHEHDEDCDHEHDEDCDHEHDEDCDHEHDEDCDHDHDGEIDEHVWLSVTNAIEITKSISKELQELDSKNKEMYQENEANYIEELEQLDQEYKEIVSNKVYNTIVFGDRFPFRYLVDDYNIDYYAAFPGCDAQEDASFETVTFLSKKIDELKLDSVLCIEGSSQKIANTIIQNTKEKNQKIITLNSLQTVTKEQIEEGITYLSVMQENAKKLKEALQ